MRKVLHVQDLRVRRPHTLVHAEIRKAQTAAGNYPFLCSFCDSPPRLPFPACLLAVTSWGPGAKAPASARWQCSQQSTWALPAGSPLLHAALIGRPVPTCPAGVVSASERGPLASWSRPHLCAFAPTVWGFARFSGCASQKSGHHF